MRLTDEELLALLADIESDRVERKESFTGDVRKRVREAVCAFANDLPGHDQVGVLFIGAKDNGDPSGCDITDQLLLSLADMKTDGNIVPLPVLSVEKRTLNGADMAVVTVMPSDTPPIRYDGRIWIRTGPRRAIANEQEERLLNERRRHKNPSFDICPVPSASLSDLSKTIFENEYLPAAFAEDVLADNSRTYEQRLASCKMITSPEDTTPTVLGLLALGKSPQDYLPGAAIQFLRIGGTELVDPIIDEEKIGGTISDMIKRTKDKLMAHNRTAVDITSGPTHRLDISYPQAALRQILYNAVLHRTYESNNAPIHVHWYNDRIEIISPGGPYGSVTEKNFGQPGIVSYRNPNIADVLKTFKYVQAFGRGIAIAQESMQNNGNPPLELEPNSSIVRCILRGK